jgi:hypothetical protein
LLFKYKKEFETAPSRMRSATAGFHCLMPENITHAVYMSARMHSRGTVQQSFLPAKHKFLL